LGSTPAEIGAVSMWIRRLEWQLYLPVQEAFRNHRRGFAGRALPGTRGGFEQIPELIARSQAAALRFLPHMEAALADGPHLVGAHLTLADLVAQTTLEFAGSVKFAPWMDAEAWPATRAALAQWQHLEGAPRGSDGP